MEVGQSGWSLLGAAEKDGVVFTARAQGTQGTGSTTTGSTAGTTTTGSTTTGSTTTGSTTAGSTGTTSVIEARRQGQVVWTRELEGRGGWLAVDASTLYVAIGGTGIVAGGAVHGEPGAAIVALDAATGAVRWRVALDAAGWVSVAAMAALPEGGVVVGGTYTNGLRAGTATVGAAGRTDGFVAAIRPTGEVAWLVRMGGVFADGVQGVAAQRGARGTRIAIAGTFQATADLQGAQLPIFDERSPLPDGFVAELDAAGKRVWSQVFGGKLLEAVAGVAIDGAGKVVVAGSTAGEAHVGGLDLLAQGAADGFVAWWNPDGSPHHAVLVGGQDFDGLSAIVAAGPSVVVGGFYSGSLSLGAKALAAGGGDDAFLAAFDASGAVADIWPVSGAGREEIVALAPVTGGFVAGLAYTAAAELAGARVGAPADPLGGAAVIVRGVR